MIYLAGQAGGTGDGTAVTEREARYAARLEWQRRPPPTPDPAVVTWLQLLQRSQSPGPFGGVPMGDPFGMSGMMGMGGFPFGGSPLGGFPMGQGLPYELWAQQQYIMQQQALQERARWDALP